MGKVWEIYEENFLKNNYCDMLNKDIAIKLNRTVKAIKLKASKFGLRKKEECYEYGKDGYECGPLTKLEIEGRILMKRFGIDFQIGDIVEISAADYESKKFSRKKKMIGEIIFKNKSCITIKGEKYCENFLISDFHTGASVIKKVEGENAIK